MRHLEKAEQVTLRTRRFRQRQLEIKHRALVDQHYFPQLENFYRARGFTAKVWTTVRDLPAFLDFQRRSLEGCVETATLYHNSEKLTLIRPRFILQPIDDAPDEDEAEL